MYSQFLLSSAPHRVEELLAFVPLVVSLPARLAVKLGLFLVACATQERLLLHTAFWAIEILITSALLAALGEGLFRADTSRNSVPHPRVLLSCETEVELPDLLIVTVAFAALSDGTQDIGSAEH